MLKFNFNNSYLTLPELFYTIQPATPVHNPQIAEINFDLLKNLNLDSADEDQDFVKIFSGQKPAEQSQHFSQAYCGHQFGHFNKLGDGRAHLVGEHINKLGQRFDLQLKGSGRTPYSRGGDGRAALGPMLREYLMGEFFHSLKIPSTRGLAVITTGEKVYREKPLDGAILTRVAQSHIRVGTFEYAAAYGQLDHVKALADYTILRHDPELDNLPNKYLLFLKNIIHRQAQLIAQWMSIGFIHGVMNTDNMTLSGETIDFGPCAFMDQFNLNQVFSSIDHSGRYAYGQQPSIAHWNLCRFAETLLPLLDSNPEKAIELAQNELQNFPQLFENHFMQLMSQKIGFDQATAETTKIVQDLLQIMNSEQLDFTRTFIDLAFDKDISGLHLWKSNWIQIKNKLGLQNQLCSSLMFKNNPAYIPRNSIVDEALINYTEKADKTLFHNLLDKLKNPFAHQNLAIDDFFYKPEAQKNFKTYCGT